MKPIEALNLISQQLSRMSGTRQDHATLLQAEAVLREVVLMAGNDRTGTQKERDTTKETVPLSNA